jgi:hypothetical protein
MGNVAMGRWKNLLLPGSLAGVVIATGMAIALLVRQFAVTRQNNAIPGLSLAGATPCQDFLAETQPGVTAIVAHNSTITEQDVQAYVSAPTVTVAHIWYFACGQRTYYYVELTGTFDGNAFSQPPGATLPSFSHKYMLFDAKTGNMLRIATGS